MDVTSIWPVAAVAYTLAGAGTLALLWAMGRRAPKGQETRLLLWALLFLALQYAGMAVDAFLRTAQAADGASTIWSVAATTALTLFWGCAILSLRAAVMRLVAPEKLPSDVEWGLFIVVGVTVAAAAGFFGLALYDVAAGASGSVRAAHFEKASRFPMPILWVLISAPAWLLGILNRRLPPESRTAWLGVTGQVQLTSLNLTEYPPHGLDTIPLGRQDFMRLFAGIYIPMALLVVIVMVSGEEHRSSAALTVALLCRLLIVPGLMSIVYFHARYSFFDVVLKRGVLFVILAAAVSGAAWFALPRVAGVHGSAGRAAFCAGAALLAWASADLYSRGERLLDRIVFHRPDYRVELQRMNKEMGRCGDPETLRAVFVGRLAKALRAEFVECAPEAKRDASLVLRLETGGRIRGYLSLGARERGQQYRSEDLNFVDAAAAQYSALGESFDARQSERLAAAAEVRALRAQINPHFLFNTLNTVADMVRGLPDAERAILNLSRVFRYALDSTRRERVALGEEIAAIRSYLEIERERFEQRLSYRIEVDDELVDTPVPPMLIQPLVENAVKHGIGPSVDGGTVRVAAERTAGGVRVTVSDDGVGFDPAATAANIGMGNVRARVEKDGGTWRVESRPGGGTRVSFELVSV